MLMFVKLTRLNGSPLYLGQNVSVEAVVPNEAAAGAGSRVTYSGMIHYVTESPDEVVAKFEALPRTDLGNSP